MEFLTNASIVIAIITGSLFIYDWINKHMKFKEAISSRFGVAMIISIITALILTYVPWKNIRYIPDSETNHQKAAVKSTNVIKRDTAKKVSAAGGKITHSLEVVTHSLDAPIIHAPRKIRKRDTTKSTQFNLPNATFNAPTQIGNGNSQTNNFEPKPREVTRQMLNDVEKQVIDKNTSISVFRRGGDPESFEFQAKYVKSLIADGYRNAYVNGQMSDPIIGGDPEVNAKRQASITFSWQGSTFEIVLPINN